MHRLAALLQRFAAQTLSHRWIGARPDVPAGRLAAAIAAKVGLPGARHDPLGRLVRLDRRQAAHVLAVAGTTSLAYGQPAPSADALRDAVAALDDLADDATFLGNGLWTPNGSSGWQPLTSATFDCGVIGFDRDRAFIFWVEEED